MSVCISIAVFLLHTGSPFIWAESGGIDLKKLDWDKLKTYTNSGMGKSVTDQGKQEKEKGPSSYVPGVKSLRSGSIGSNGANSKKRAYNTEVVSQLAEAPSVSFINLIDGQFVPESFEVKFEVRGMKHVSAGKPRKGHGHHHLLIYDYSTQEGSRGIPAGATIVPSTYVMDFGGAESHVTLRLPGGTGGQAKRYDLTLQFGDNQHRSYGVALRSTVSVYVVGSGNNLKKKTGLNLAKDSDIWFKNIRDGQVLPKRFKTEIGLRTERLLASTGIDNPNVHLLVFDHRLKRGFKSLPKGSPIPRSFYVKNLGALSTEAWVALRGGTKERPRKYDLTLILSDGNRQAMGRKYKETITVKVVDPPGL